MAQLLHVAQKAIIEKGRKVLVIKNPDKAKYNPGMIHFPGGRMKFGEDLDEQICREVWEETGVNIKPLEPIGIAAWQVIAGTDSRKELEKDDLHVVAIIRRCKFISGKHTLSNNVDDEDLESVYWESPEKLVKNKNFDKKLLPALKMYLKVKKEPRYGP